MISKNRKIGFAVIVSVAILLGIAFYYLSANKVLPQSSIYLLNDVKLPEKGQRVLVYSPHPDDESLGVGGYILESIKKGAVVKVVLVTDGNKHGLRDKRYDEFKTATGILGVPEENLIFLSYPDGGLVKIDQAELASNLEKQISDFKPEIVIYPNPLDSHPDHSLIGVDMKQFLQGSATILGYQYLIHYPDFPQPKMYRKDLYLLPAQNAVRFDKEWQRLILSTGVEDQKAEAVFSYKTQIRVPVLRSLMMSSIRKNELFSEGN